MTLDVALTATSAFAWSAEQGEKENRTSGAFCRKILHTTRYEFRQAASCCCAAAAPCGRPYADSPLFTSEG